jgi:hypothetical protein
VNTLKNKSVLMYDDFRFIYASDHGGKPSPNSCFLLTYVNIRAGYYSTAWYPCKFVSHSSIFLASFLLLESQVCYLFVC